MTETKWRVERLWYTKEVPLRTRWCVHDEEKVYPFGTKRSAERALAYFLKGEGEENFFGLPRQDYTRQKPRGTR